MNSKARVLGPFLVALLVAGFPARAASDSPATRGYLYGTVETTTGKTYRGLLRWGTEEAFWDDLFNSAKPELPYVEKYDREKEGRKSRIKIFGVTIGYRWDEESSSRVFTARFGDIRKIEPERGERVRLTMKDGAVLSLEGGSNDVEATITVRDESLGDVRLDWESIERIEFAPTPAAVKPQGTRLYGTLRANEETFEGFIQWDNEECLSIDKLDGESEDGDLSIEMGNIRAIEKHDSDGSWIELKDGRKFLLEGTNDVDESIRGIFVETEKHGRVNVSWKAFRRLDFREAPHSGKGYDDYHAPWPLSGTVRDQGGQTQSGRLVFDLDEAASFEILDGARDGIEFQIPFERVRSIEPQKGNTSKVVLHDGPELILGNTQDVSEDNDGVVIQRDGREVHVPWNRILRIEFDGGRTGSSGVPGYTGPAEAPLSTDRPRAAPGVKR